MQQVCARVAVEKNHTIRLMPTENSKGSREREHECEDARNREAVNGPGSLRKKITSTCETDRPEVTI